MTVTQNDIAGVGRAGSDPAIVGRARNAVFLVFAASGLAFSTLASRLPDVKRILDLTPGELGTTLLAGAAGAVLGLPMSGRLIERFGTRAAVRVGATGAAIGLVAAGLCVDLLHSRPLLMLALFLSSVGIGVWDVAMNHEGTVVERGLGRAIMPWFHAFFSGATVLAALFGSLMTGLEVPVWVHLAAMSLVALAAAWRGTASFFPDEVDESHDASDSQTTSATSRGPSAWLERRTLLIGVVVLVAAFTEGTANDWIAVALTEGHGLPAWAGVLGFAVFLGFMTLGRIVGTVALDRFGRVPVLRSLFAVAIAGGLLVVFGGPLGAFAGAALWGLGASLGFPVGMSAAADEPARAAARLSVVSTIGYLAFLAGPPLLGYLGDQVGVLPALLAAGILLVPAILAVPAVREPAPLATPEA